MQVLSNSVFIVSQRDTDDQRNTNQEKKKRVMKGRRDVFMRKNKII